MINRIILTGRVTADPELRKTQEGTSVINFSVAVDRSYRSADGEKVTDFFSVIAWRKLAEICSEYLYKGQLIAIDGKLQTRKYESNGETRKFVEVVADSVQFMTRKESAREVEADEDIPF